MGVYRRADSKYWWMLLEHSGEKRSTGVLRAASTIEQQKEQRTAAEDIYRAAMTKLAKAAHDLPTGPAETIAFDAYADWYQAHTLKKQKGYARALELLPPLRAFFGAVDLTAIDAALVSEYETARLTAPIGTTGRTVKWNTVNREVDLLKAMLRDAVPKYLKASPLAGRKKLKGAKIVKRVIRTAEEERRLLATMSRRDQAFYLTAVDSMMRLINLIHLRRDEDKGTHFDLMDSKTGPYQAPITARVRAALDALPKDSPYYFPHRRTAKTERDRRGAVRRWLQRRCKDAGIPYGRAIGGVTFHTATRGTGATRLLRAGVDPKTVMGAGNWKDVRSMMDYAELDAERVSAAVNAHAPEHPTLEADMATIAAARNAAMRARRSKGGKARWRNRDVIADRKTSTQPDAKRKRRKP
jgi:hypothetical protein